jgi:hypothetical protein
LYFNIPDTIGNKPAGQTTSADSLHIGVAFKNVSNVSMDSVALKVVVYDTVGNAIQYPMYKLRGLPAGDTMNINLTLNVGELISGLYNVYVSVNPGVQQPEQFSFNNFFYKYVYINRSGALPVTLVSFNASRSGNNVQTAWQTANEANVKQYVVQHSVSGMSFKDIGRVALSNSATPNNHYTFNHVNAPYGRNYYRLKVLDNDGSFKYSQVRLVTIDNKTVINVYPNPVIDILNIVVSNGDGKPSNVKLMDMYGQQLWSSRVNGTAQVNMKAWARGTYILQVNEGDEVYTYKIYR